MAAKNGYLAEKMATYEQRAWDRKMLSLADSFVKSKEDRDLVQADFSAYVNDPVGFFRDVLKRELWSRQAEIADAIVDHAQVAAKTGHKIGKSLLAAGLALWWACTRPESLVIITAPGYEQVKDIIWKELHKLHRVIKSHVGGVMPLDPNTGLSLDNGSLIKGLTTNTPERVAGRSGQSVFVIVDEASGYPDALMEALQTSTAGGDDEIAEAGEARILAIGNPTQTSGWFFEIFRTDNPDWSKHTVSSEDTPNARAANDNGFPLEKPIPGLASRAFIALMRRQYGPDPDTHPIYMVRIKGLYPERSSNAVIGLANVDQAVSDARRKSIYIPSHGEVAFGVDVARFGDDESVVAPSIDKWMGELEPFSGLDGPALSNEVQRMAHPYIAKGMRVRVNIDGTGVGASVVDSLIRCELARQGKLYVCDIIASASPDADCEAKYLNLRAQLWFGMNDWLRDGGSLPKDSELTRELLAPTYKFAPKGPIQVESKDDIKKKIKRSPDRADAACLSVYRGRSGLIEFTSGERVRAEQSGPSATKYRTKRAGGAL